MSAVSEFQTAGAEQRKARSAKLVLVVGLQTHGVAEERIKPTSDDERLDVTAEVDRCGGVVDLVRQDGQLVVNPLSNREPSTICVRIRNVRKVHRCCRAQSNSLKSATNHPSPPGSFLT